MDHTFRGVSDSARELRHPLEAKKCRVSARDQSHVKRQGVRRNAFTISASLQYDNLVSSAKDKHIRYYKILQDL